jgi:hypothetical protein
MSQHHLRADKTCLNCGTQVADRFCPHCGQENLEPKESVWHMFVHFFNDITHFDGKLFRTVKLLFTKPGFLSEGYMNGRRATHLNPVRMYLFISFVFFFLQFSLTKPHHTPEPQRRLSHADSLVVQDSIRRADSLLEISVDTVLGGKFRIARQSGGNMVIETNQNSGPAGLLNNINDTSIAQYEARQKSLPKEERDDIFTHWIAKRSIAASEYRNKHSDTFNQELIDRFVHSIPKMLFISIPIFAFLLWLLYIRSRKQYYFVTHGIFTIHMYCTVFLLLLLLTPLSYIDSNKVAFVRGLIIMIVPAIYLYKGMRRFYKQRRAKTVIKFFILLFFSGIAFTTLILIIMFNSFLTIGMAGH